MTDCIFCKILKGEIPATKIYEDENTFAFLDISPINKGHTLVIPKKHYETFDKIPKNELLSLISTIHKISKAIAKISDGFNIIQNNKKSAGQLVPHVHFHIIPRHNNDGFKFNWKNKEYKNNKEAEEYQTKIKNLL